MTYGATTPAPAQTWPVKAPDAYLDYSYNGAADLVGDTLASIAVSVSPSGAGELVASLPSFAGAVSTVWLAGGVAGRSYIVKIVGTCTSSRIIPWTIGITVDPTTATYPLAAPPSSGFGAAARCPGP